VKQVRTFMETKVAPIIHESIGSKILSRLNCCLPIELNLGGVGLEGYGCRGGGRLLAGLVANGDGDASTLYFDILRVHSGLGNVFPSTTVDRKSKNRSGFRPMARMEKIGCFGLTEPLVGSGAGGGLLTTAKREGDTWIINGQKKWIGNAPWCDISIIWARDLADNQVKGFIVENKTTPGFKVEKIQNKIALKVVRTA